MDRRSIEPRTRPGAVLSTLAVAIAAAGAAVFLIAWDEHFGAGLAVAVSGSALALGDLRAREERAAKLSLSSSVAERMVDGAVFGALAWVLLPGSTRAGAAALVALSASYVASYVRAKAVGLGFEMEEPLLAQPLRLAAVALGLITGGVEAGLWAAAGVSLVAALSRGVEVAEKRVPR
jgi:hypothetical protein